VAGKSFGQVNMIRSSKADLLLLWFLSRNYAVAKMA